MFEQQLVAAWHRKTNSLHEHSYDLKCKAIPEVWDLETVICLGIDYGRLSSMQYFPRQCQSVRVPIGMLLLLYVVQTTED